MVHELNTEFGMISRHLCYYYFQCIFLVIPTYLFFSFNYLEFKVEAKYLIPIYNFVKNIYYLQGY